MTSATIGLALALLGAVLAMRQAAHPDRTYYGGQLYHMTAAAHRRYAFAFAVFAAIFASALGLPAIPVVPLLAIFAVMAILYGATFIRGAIGEDE